MPQIDLVTILRLVKNCKECGKSDCTTRKFCPEHKAMYSHYRKLSKT